MTKFKAIKTSRIVLAGKKLSLIIMILFLTFCNKDKGPDIPEAYVNIYLRPNSIDYIADGTWVYVTANEPSRGIIVYRLFHDSFKAYERTCTYDPNACCTSSSSVLSCSKLTVEFSGLTITDTCCHSQFLITDGTPFSGPATFSLKEYNTEYDGDVLHIFN